MIGFKCPNCGRKTVEERFKSANCVRRVACAGLTYAGGFWCNSTDLVIAEAKDYKEQCTGWFCANPKCYTRLPGETGYERMLYTMIIRYAQPYEDMNKCDLDYWSKFIVDGLQKGEISQTFLNDMRTLAQTTKSRVPSF